MVKLDTIVLKNTEEVIWHFALVSDIFCKWEPSLSQLSSKMFQAISFFESFYTSFYPCVCMCGKLLPNILYIYIKISVSKHEMITFIVFNYELL